jgi:hypothetical protein
VIGAIHTDAGLVIDVELPAGAAAFFDREWLPVGRSGPIPALVTGEAEAARALALIAEQAIAAAPPGAVAVAGTGLVAELARRRLAAAGRLAAGDGPRAVIETSGDPAAIEAATRAVATHGTVVLAGETLGREYELDLYSDVHVRALRLVPRTRGSAVDHAEAPEQVPAPTTVIAGQPIDLGGLWFRVNGRESDGG